MSFLYFEYGYLTIVTVILTILFYYCVTRQKRQLAISLFIFASLWLIGVFVIPEKSVANVAWGGFEHRSNCEVFLGIGVIIYFAYIVKSLCKRLISILIILLTPLQLFDLLYVIPYELCEITSFVIVIRLIKSNVEQQYALRIIGFVVSWIILMWACVSIDWKGVLPDCRSNKLCLIKSQESNAHLIEYYEMRNAEDTYERLILTLNLLKNIDNATIHFVADEIAAYSFLKTTLNASPYAVDPFSYDEEQTQYFIVKKDSGYFSYVNYHSIRNVDKSSIIVKDSVLLCNDKSLNMKCFSDCINNVFSRNISPGTYQYLINTHGDTLLIVNRVDRNHFDIIYR